MPPTVLMEALESVRRRVRVFSVLYGLGLLVAAAVAMLLAVVLLDYLLNLPPAPRLIVILAALVGIGYFLAHWVVRAALGKLGLSDVAGKLENVFPEFDDRLRSTVNFLTKGTPGSDMMKQHVVSQAGEISRRVNLNSAVKPQPVIYALSGAVVTVAVVMLLGTLVGRDYLNPALTRLFNPFSRMPYPKSVQIALDPLPDKVPVGGHVPVRLKLVKGDADVFVCYRYDDGRTEKEKMDRGANGYYATSLDARGAAGGNGLMTVWVESGDDATPRRQINVVQRLSIKSVQVEVAPPPYAAAEGNRLFDFNGTPLTVTFGSTLTMRLTFSRDLDGDKGVTFIAAAEGAKIPALQEPVSISGSLATARWVAADKTTFQVRAFDQDSFANNDVTTFQVIVKPDEMPGVQITTPNRTLECTPQWQGSLVAAVDDDFAIQTAKLIVTHKVNDKEVAFPAIDLLIDGKAAPGVIYKDRDTVGDRRHWEINYNWDLAKLGALTPGDQLDYYVQVTDNYYLPGQNPERHEPVNSNRMHLTILSQEQFAAAMADLIARVRETVMAASHIQRAVKDQTDFLRQDLKNQKPDANNPAKNAAAQAALDQTAKTIKQQQDDAAAKTKSAATALDEINDRLNQNQSTAQDLKDIAQNVSKDLTETAEHPMKDAAANVAAAKDQKLNPDESPAQQQQTKDARDQQLADAAGKQQEAADRLDAAAEKMGKVGGLAQAIDALKAVQAQQDAIKQAANDIMNKNMGKKPEQMSKEDQDKLNKLAEEQKNLGDKTQKIMDDMNKTADKMQKSDPASADAMKKAAQAGQQQQVPGQMKNASNSMNDNHVADTNDAQAQIEIGLQMMIRELQEAQRIQLEELARKLAELQDQVNNLVRQQASLNYSNLALQGDEALKKVEKAVIDQLVALGQLNPKDPPQDLKMQTSLQYQTALNTSSISKMAEDLPEGAAIVTQLNRAAERMGAAVTALRDAGPQAQQLALAYDPPQIDALAALLNAKDLVDKQAEKANEQRDKAKKDAIRAVYEKILEAQKLIDKDTKSIDGAPRPGGALGHADSQRLGQLPGDQGELVTKTSALDDPLAQLGGIVYTWANKDIVDSMKSVKLDLARPETGVATQAEQTRIEEQLQAMIDSLKIEPKTTEFEQKRDPGGGGGSGQKPPKLPPEAELRLLKQLQQAINKSTEVISGQPNPDQPKLVSLGDRQGKLRTLLDQLLQKASQGKISLGPETDDKVPEEATDQRIDEAELEHLLLNDDGNPDGRQLDQDIPLLGQRMHRDKVRLNGADPGPVTQAIQKKILQSLDLLIEASRAELRKSKQKPKPGDEPQPPDPSASLQPGQKPTPGPSSNSGSTPATESTPGRDGDTTSPTQDITERNNEWGKLSPRLRRSISEIAGEKPLEKFKSLIDDYYRAVGTKLSQP